MWGNFVVFTDPKIAVFVPRTSIEEIRENYKKFEDKCNFIFSLDNSESMIDISQEKIKDLTLDNVSKILCNQKFFTEFLEYEYLIQYLFIYCLKFLSEGKFKIISEEDFSKEGHNYLVF